MVGAVLFTHRHLQGVGSVVVAGYVIVSHIYRILNEVAFDVRFHETRLEVLNIFPQLYQASHKLHVGIDGINKYKLTCIFMNIFLIEGSLP